MRTISLPPGTLVRALTQARILEAQVLNISRGERDYLLSIYDRLAVEMPATFHLDLILNMQTSDPQSIIGCHSSGDSIGAPKASIRICDERHSSVNVGNNLTSRGKVVQ